MSVFGPSGRGDVRRQLQVAGVFQDILLHLLSGCQLISQMGSDCSPAMCSKTACYVYMAHADPGPPETLKD